jgi:hypothetical protein
VIGTDLYRKGASTGVSMKCILRSESLQLLAEIHSGECGCHAASTNLVGKVYRWLAELPHVIWGLRTQVSFATGFSPFFLVYGSEAVLRTDVAFGAPRIQFYKKRPSKQAVSTLIASKNRDLLPS